MADQNIQEKIMTLEAQIALLPKGSVGQKTVNGKEYFYLRWTENKKRKEKYVPADEIEALKSDIEKRKALDKELRELRRQAPAAAAPKPAAHTFLTNVRTGSALRSFAAPVKSFKKRDCFRDLHEYLYGPPLRSPAHGKDNADPADLCRDDGRGACKDGLRSDHKKRYAGRRESGSENSGGGGIPLCFLR